MGLEAWAYRIRLFPTPYLFTGHQLCGHLPELSSPACSFSEVGVVASWMGSSAVSFEGLKHQSPHTSVYLDFPISTQSAYVPCLFLGNAPNPLNSLCATDTAQHHGQQHSNRVGPLQATHPLPHSQRYHPICMMWREQPSPVDRTMTVRIPMVMPAMAPADQDDWESG